MSKFVIGSVSANRLGVNQGLTGTLPQVDLDPNKFNALIADRGYDVVWEKATICPNQSNVPAPGTHDINCGLCDRSGFLYIDPIYTKMLVQGVSLKESYYIQGRFDGGRATITSQSENPVSYWDKITLRNSLIRYSESIRRRENTHVDLFKYVPNKVLSVIGTTVAGKGLRVFKEGTDYRVEDNNLIWTKNKKIRPLDNTYVTAMYQRRPTYVILDLQKQHRDSSDTVEGVHRAMPIQAIAMLDFLVRDEAKDQPAQVTPESPFSND